MNPDLVDDILKAFKGTSAGYLKVENSHSKIEATKAISYKEGNSQSLSSSVIVGKDNTGFDKSQSRKKKSNFHDIKSIHVGFVQRHETDKDLTIVKLREVVEKGQLLAYIRSMNIRYEVLSDIKGKIVEVLVEDTQAVEYGQPLFRLKPI